MEVGMEDGMEEDTENKKEEGGGVEGDKVK